MLSGRIPADLTPTALALARGRCRVDFDLTVSNPTRCGLPYPQEILKPLADSSGLVYDPQPRGLPRARETVAALYASGGNRVHPDQVVLTASTSEAYALLFALLCDPGQAVAAPAPSYPLVEHLARAAGVRAIPYKLDAEGWWRVDAASLIRALECGARAVVAVHPNNPTGSWLHPEDAEIMAVAAARSGAGLIVDEVFLDYPLGEEPPPPSLAGRTDCLTFALGGLSKSVGLPQLKLGWIVVSGPPRLQHQALEGLEYLADTFLSVATPVQLALPELLAAGGSVRQAISERCRTNLATLHEAAVQAPPVTVLTPEGGWSAVLRIPSIEGEEALVLALLEKDGVAVQPGYFFDFPRDGYLVVSLLPPPDAFAAGIQRVMARLATAPEPT